MKIAIATICRVIMYGSGGYIGYYLVTTFPILAPVFYGMFAWSVSFNISRLVAR